MGKMWDDIAAIVEAQTSGQPGEPPHDPIAECHRESRLRYENYMRTHTNRDFGDEHRDRFSDGRDAS